VLVDYGTTLGQDGTTLGQESKDSITASRRSDKENAFSKRRNTIKGGESLDQCDFSL
jgi:hypothetical protein